MYRILIVDDEPAIVNGLVLMLSKNEELDICKAISSIDALEIVKRMRIDILLTDIRMPIMSGLQLREKAQEYWPSCKTVFLSGYSEFDYVYEAIQRPDTSYILKTEGNDVVLKAVNDVITKINTEKEQWDIVNEAKRQIVSMNQMFRKELLESLLFGDYDDIYSVTTRFAELGICLDINNNVIIILGKLNEQISSKPNERFEIYCAVSKMLERSFCSNIIFESTVIANSEIIFFMQPANNGSLFYSDDGMLNWSKAITFIKGVLESVQDKFKETFNMPLSFIIARRFAEWDMVHEEFETMHLISTKILLKGAQLLVDLSIPNTLLKDSKKIENAMTNSSDFNKKIRNLEKILEDSSDSVILDSIRDIMNIIKTSFSINYFTGVEKYYSLLMVFISFINRHSLSSNLNYDLKIEKFMVLDLINDWDDIEKYINELGRYLCMCIKEEKEQEGELIILNIQNYIQHNLGGDLSLTKLAETVYLNPSYLSRYYKQATGHNISDFINNAKIETAKKMLEDTQMKINEIASELGFEITSYFTTFFKRLTSITPQDYRNSLLK